MSSVTDAPDNRMGVVCVNAVVPQLLGLDLATALHLRRGDRRVAEHPLLVVPVAPCSARTAYRGGQSVTY